MFRKKKKKELKAGINIKTLGNTVYLKFDEKTILKAGTIVVNYNTETPDVSLFDWHIGYKKEKKWWMIFRKRICGVQIEGDSLIISGESKNNIVLASEEDDGLVNTSKPLYEQGELNLISQMVRSQMPIELYDLMISKSEIRRYLKNNFVDGYNKGIHTATIKKQSDLKKAENTINQLRGYFQAEEDGLIKNSSMRMLDELEMILKS